MGRLDLRDPPRDEDIVETCACCRERPAMRIPDPRLPLLRIASCRSCRNLIARATGWRRRQAGALWEKTGQMPVSVPTSAATGR